MSYDEVLSVMGEPNSIEETRRIEFGSTETRLQLFVAIELSYDNALLTMYYYEDMPESGTQTDAEILLTAGATLRQAQFLDSAVFTAKNVTVGTAVGDLIYNYGLDTTSSNFETIDMAFGSEDERDNVKTYDSFCSISNSESPFLGLTFLTSGDKVASFIIFDPVIYDIPARVVPLK